MRIPILISRIFILATLLISCKKIELPEASAKAVFGQWKYLNSSGGWSGGPCWPSDKSIWIEFKENGHYKRHEQGKLVHSEKFTFKQVDGANGSQLVVIAFNTNGMKSFKVSGDTLFLSDYAIADGCNYVFVKK